MEIVVAELLVASFVAFVSLLVMAISSSFTPAPFEPELPVAVARYRR